jgi:hypothetical protein
MSLSVVRLNVVKLSVVAPKTAPDHQKEIFGPRKRKG